MCAPPRTQNCESFVLWTFRERLLSLHQISNCLTSSPVGEFVMVGCGSAVCTVVGSYQCEFCVLHIEVLRPFIRHISPSAERRRVCVHCMCVDQLFWSISQLLSLTCILFILTHNVVIVQLGFYLQLSSLLVTAGQHSVYELRSNVLLVQLLDNKNTGKYVNENNFIVNSAAKINRPSALLCICEKKVRNR